MNNLDIFILIVVAVSGLIALNRGLIKEVLSIVGWTLSIVTIVLLLPIVQPWVQNSVHGDTAAMIAASALIFILFFVIWFIISMQIVDKIRASKLSSIDRILGLFFGIIRACILIILFNILLGWVIPTDEQPQVFKDSKYFNLAGDFAEPIEKLLPQNMVASAKEQKTVKDAPQSEKVVSEDMDKLFDKLVQPQVKNDKQNLPSANSTSSGGYNQSEQKSLDRLIEMTGK